MSRTSLTAGIVTDDPVELIEFYRSALGFALESTSDFPQGAVHRLRVDDARLKLYAPAGGATTPARPDPWFRDRGFAYAALHVDDAAAAVESARSAGASVLTEPVEHRPGAVHAMIEDPQGNVWELLQEA